MSVSSWTKHFQKMQEGKLYPEQNGVWRLTNQSDSNLKKVSRISKTIRKIATKSKKGKKRKLSLPIRLKKGIKGNSKHITKQSSNKLHARKKTRTIKAKKKNTKTSKRKPVF